MKDKQYYIEAIAQKFKNGHDELEALLFLQEEGLSEAECREIMDVAVAQKDKERLPQLAKKNKMLFMLWLSLTVLIFIVDFFLLPNASLIDYRFILCLLGTGTLALCTQFSILYYKTWTPEFLEKRGEVNINFQIFPLLMIPAVVVYFLISWRFSSVADQSLAKDMVKTKGTILSGYSVGGRRGDLVSEVTVKFQTQEGKTIITTKDVGSYAFKNFYEGQKVDMVYSKSNPENINLLTSESEVKDLTNSAERDITPTDLFELMDVAPADMEAHLDKITFGWQAGSTDSSWVNSKKLLAVKLGAKDILLSATQSTGLMFPKRLIALGFKPMGSGSSQPYSLKPQVFENDKYLVSITYKNMEGTIICIIGAAKK